MKIISQNINSEIKKLNLKANFNDKIVSSVATFTYVELFKKIINLSALIKNGVAYKKGDNSVFSAAETIEYLIDANILGYSRFNSIEDLRKDAGYKKIKETDRSMSST